MNKVLFVVLIVIFLLAMAIPAFAAPVEKVDVCHKPSTNAQATITVGEPALSAHLTHGDVEMACEDMSAKSDLCNILDGWSMMFGNELIFHVETFTDTNLFHTENVTMIVDNQSQNKLIMRGVIGLYPVVYKSALSGLQVDPGTTASQTFDNVTDPGSQTEFQFVFDNALPSASSPATVSFTCE